MAEHDARLSWHGNGIIGGPMANPQIQQVIDSMWGRFLPWIIVAAVLSGIAQLLKGKRSRPRSRRKSSIADDLILLPWWISAVLALAAYLLLPGLLPQPFVKTGIVGMIALALLMIAAVSAMRAWSNRRMLEAQTGLDWLRELPWKRFEDLLAEAYRRQGYKVEETLGGAADGGVDLVLLRGGEVILVQCKRWKGKPVPVQTVRELSGVLHDRGASSAKLVATTRFTSDAIAFAKGKPIELVDSDAILHLLARVQTSGRMGPAILGPDASAVDPQCPSGHGLMVKRTARRGANAGSDFWGCSKYPRCRETRSI